MAQIVLEDMPRRNQSTAKLWCFISRDAEGNEAPCGMFTPGGWIMMMSSKWEVIQRMRPNAIEMARQCPALKIILRQYAEATDLETL